MTGNGRDKQRNEIDNVVGRCKQTYAQHQPQRIVKATVDVPSAQEKSHCNRIDSRNRNLRDIMHELYAEYGLTSLLVEAGPQLLRSFINENLWDEIRVEIAPFSLGNDGTCEAPLFPGEPDRVENAGDHKIYNMYNKHF